MDIQLDRLSKIPFYLQILQQIRDRILSGALPEGTLLPPERSLASELGVNRSTILNAYRELKKDGLVEARVGRGTTVLPRPVPSGPKGVPRPLPWRELFREEPGDIGTPIRDLLEKSSAEDAIPFSVGLPSPDLLPLDTYREIQEQLIAEQGPNVFMQSPTEGIPALRETLVQWMLEKGINCHPEEVLVLTGSQQGLDLAARIFLEPGDAVIVEEPTYFGALLVFRSAGARIIPAPTDEHGLCTDVLPGLFERHRPKMLYIQPSFQNPSGVTTSLARRRHLLELASRYGVPVLEDDAYSDLIYEGDPLPPLKALDRQGVVLYLSTISKLLFPGLRIGWLVAPAPVVRRFASAKQGIDLHGNTPGQWVVERFIAEGHLKQHLEASCRAYARRRDLMLKELERRAPPGMSWSRPEGGLSIWCRLPDRTERTLLVSEAAAAKVSFLPGWCCFSQETETHYLRLNFSYAKENKIRPGIARLMGAVQASSAPSRLRKRAVSGPLPIV
jgi:DNA-binding transcriptional MocR family regulator